MAKNGNTKPTGDVANKDGAVKKKDGRGGYRERNGGDLYTSAANSLSVEPGDCDRITQYNLKLYAMEPVDLTDTEAVDARVREFVSICAQHDVKPGVVGLGLALGGIDRRRIWEMRNDVPGRNVNVPKSTRDCLKKAHLLMESLWETYMLSNKINNISAIFYAKNVFGYTDRQDLVVTPGDGQEDAFNEQDIASRYIAPPTTIESEFTE